MELGFLTSFAIFLFLFFLVAVEDSVGSFSNVAVAVHVSDLNIKDGRGASGPERISSNIAAQLASFLSCDLWKLWFLTLQRSDLGYDWFITHAGRC